MRSPRPLRRVTALAATALCAASVAVPAGAGEIIVQSGGEGVPAVRYAGEDRYDTAATIATDDTANGANYDGDAVILTRGDTFPDGLAGSYLAGVRGAPVLLTETDSLPSSTADAIDELAPTTVYLLGGRTAISASVASGLRDDGHDVQRISGPDRYETAAEIATSGADSADTAIVALGTNFPDALVAGPLSAAGGLPLLLTETGSLPDATADALESLGVTDVLLAGGTVAVSAEVEAEIEALGINVRRLDGTDRYDTARQFARWAVNNLGFTTTHVNLATGENFADALSLGAHAGMDFSGPAPVLLTQTAALPDATASWLSNHASGENSAIHVAGGTVAIQNAVVREARFVYSPAGYMSPADFAASLDAQSAREHLQAFQQIADDNGDTREASGPGFDASVDYIQGLLDDAGYETEVQDFSFDYFEENADPTFSQTAGDDGMQEFTVAEGPDDSDADFTTMSYSGTGTVTDTPITAVDLSLEGDETNSDSGCDTNVDGEDEDDFTSFPDGDVALVQRGACSFAEKAENAFEAGASGVIIFNQGDSDDPGRQDVFFGTLGAPIDVDGDDAADGPVIGISHGLGVALATDDESGDDVTVSISVDALNEVRESSNLLAETPDGDADNVIMAGAHLDSVPEGPGINDNGSGSAAILETALQLAASEAPITNKVRFAWWGAEEAGLVGSTHYVDTVLINEDFTDLTDEGRAVALYLNFDMVGSPNFARFVYDGDGSEFGIGDPASGVIEQGFVDVFDSMDLASEPTEFSGRSDYAEFQVAEIPAGGLFTGAEGIKTDAQVDLYGGTAGEAYDPNYHGAGDTIDNVNMEVFGEMLAAIGHEVMTYALSTDSIDNAGAEEREQTAASSLGTRGAQRGHVMTR